MTDEQVEIKSPMELLEALAPLMMPEAQEALLAMPPQRQLPRLLTLILGDIVPALAHTVLNFGALQAEMGERLENIEGHPFLGFADSEDLDDPEVFDGFLSLIIKLMGQYEAICTDAATLEDVRYVVRLCERVKLGIVYPDGDEEGEGDEESNDEDSSSADDDDTSSDDATGEASGVGSEIGDGGASVETPKE